MLRQISQIKTTTFINYISKTLGSILIIFIILVGFRNWWIHKYLDDRLWLGSSSGYFCRSYDNALCHHICSTRIGVSFWEYWFQETRDTKYLVVLWIYISKSNRYSKKISIYTNKDLKTPQAFLYTYKSLQLLLTRINLITRRYFLLFFNNSMTSLSVGGQVIYITLRQHFTLEIRFGILIFIVASTMYMIITYYTLGLLHELSKNVISSWRKNSVLEMKPLDRILVQKYAKSFKPLRMELGDFGYYRKTTSIRIIGKLIYYTARGLMILQKFV